MRHLRQEIYEIKEVVFGEKTEIHNHTLILDKNPIFSGTDAHIREAHVRILRPDQKDIFVNSNLDFVPIACKVNSELGEGITRILDGVTVMINGVEEVSGYQPANIGSSEGILKDHVIFNKAGTPKSSDYIIQIDVLFRNGEGRTSRGIMAAHRLADQVIQLIREQMNQLSVPPGKINNYYDASRPGCRKIALVKIVSGLGNMYDTTLFPYEPAGFTGAHNMMDTGNLPYVLTPNQVRDGAIHSLL